MYVSKRHIDVYCIRVNFEFMHKYITCHFMVVELADVSTDFKIQQPPFRKVTPIYNAHQN